MPRPIYYPTRDSLVLDSFGNPCAGNAVRVFSRQSGGTQITDLVFVGADGAPGSSVPSGVLLSDSNGVIPAFAGPDGGPRTLWVDTGPGGSRLALTSDPTSTGGGGVTGTGGGSVTTTSAIAADAALASTYVPIWKANTSYPNGQVAVLPDGSVGTAKATFTTGASYDAANWNISASSSAGFDGGSF